jgi:VIT1/CCC1 family predicted Fe2+/Mn2+ transporter
MNQKKIIKQPVLKSSFLKQAVIGLSDGLILAFAIATALSIHYDDNYTIAKVSGIISIMGAVIIGIGGYFSARFRMESLTAKTIEEEERWKKEEIEKTVTLFQRLGIAQDMQEQTATEIEKDSNDWKVFLEKNQQVFEIPDKKELPLTGIIIGLSFIAGAFVSLVAYYLLHDTKEAFKFSIFINLPLLFFTGLIKSKINGEPVIGGGIRLMLLGAAAVAGAYLVAGIFIKS